MRWPDTESLNACHVESSGQHLSPKAHRRRLYALVGANKAQPASITFRVVEAMTKQELGWYEMEMLQLIDLLSNRKQIQQLLPLILYIVDILRNRLEKTPPGACTKPDNTKMPCTQPRFVSTYSHL